MKTVIRIESQNDDAHQAGKMLMEGRIKSLRNTRAMVAAIREYCTPRGVYRVTGFIGDDPRRELQIGTKDYTGANSVGSRGVCIEYVVSDGCYVVLEPPRPHLWIVIRGGEIIETTIDEVKEWLK